MKHFRKWLIVVALRSLLLASGAGAPQQAYVWWEGENFKETNIPEPVNMRLPGNRKPEQQAKLSGGRWLTPQGPESETPYFVKYEVDVPKTATYELWVRKFWHHGPFRWRFGEAEWRVCDKLALHDETFLELHWGAHWVFLGDVALQKGTHTFHIEMLGKKGGGAIDCFVLSEGPFTPRGKLRPGERAGTAAEGFFAWEPDADPLADGCPIDLRHLNEPLAGQRGFVRREGDHFVLGDGSPVRFWMVQANLSELDNRHIDRWARRLAKYGVNLVRMQLSDFFNNRVQGNHEAFQKALERLHYVVAALKKQGIYSYLGHLYWHTHNPINDDVLPGFGKGRNAIAALIFSDRFQKWYKDYVRAIMSPVNPYTKVPLGKDPAVAFVEIWNESSLLFWTFNPKQFPQVERDLIEKDFGDWLVAKYGSLEKAVAAWGEDKMPGVRTPDRLAEGRVGLYAAGHLTSQWWAVSQRVPQRAADQLQWMVESTLRFYTKMVRDLRAEVGLGQLITGSNWRTADEKVLGSLERYTYTATDAVLRNDYFGPEYAKDGNKRFYAVDEGDTFRQFSSLKPPACPGPLLTPLITGHPLMVTENNWERPLRYRAEWPFLVATYARMMGVDGWCFFALNTSEWQHTMTVWDLNNPTVLGQFPATALMFRRGDVAEPDAPAVRETISLADAYAMRGTKLFAAGGRDLLWVARIGEKETARASGYELDPKAFLIGPVLHEFVNGPSKLQTVELAKYIDSDKSIVRSMTGELLWDYGKGVVTVNASRAQGATGFLKAAGRIELGDIALEAGNEYGTLLAVSLDGQPLKTSKRILLQAATWDQPYGFHTTRQGEYERITSLGGYPLNVEKIDMRVTLKGAAGRAATVLDENGYPTKRRAQAEAKEGALTIRLPEDAIYTLIE